MRRYFSNHPLPNRTCTFQRIRLSSSRKSGTVGLTVKSEASHFPWRSLVPVNLPPFASWTAFPSSDYYGGSVALRLAPVRRSRLSCSSDVQDGCRCPVRVLQAPDGSPASVERVQSGAANPVLVSRYPPGILEAPDVSHRFRSAFLQIGHWGSSSLAFTIPSGPRPASSWVASLLPAFPNRLVSPWTFVARWVRWPKGITLNPSRVARGSTQAAMRRTAAERLSPSARERVHERKRCQETFMPDRSIR